MHSRNKLLPPGDGSQTGPSLAAAVVVLACSLAGASWAEAAVFRIYVEAAGVYGLAWEDLAAAGWEEPLESAGLALSSQGRPVPIWIEDGGDATFGPGDRLEWVGEHLRGESTYYHPHAAQNVYVLETGAEGGARMRSRGPGEAAACAPHRLRAVRHQEKDELLVRVRQRDLERSGDPELWYWAKLTHVDPRAFTAEIDLPDLDPDSPEPSRLRVHFRALSETHERRRVSGTFDHRVEARLGGEPLAVAEWNGRNVHRLELELPPGRLARGMNRLELRVPARRPEGWDREILDVVMLDWIEVEHPRADVLGDGQLKLAEPGGGGRVELSTEGSRGARLVAYSDTGARIVPVREGGLLRFAALADETAFRLAVPPRLARPARVELDRPSDWLREDRRADYLMIAHRSLLAAVRPLAEAHRGRGLEVALIDVQDLYDELSHGIVDPRAIRDFVAHAYHRWRPPAPRFVLLVGDASWDVRSERIDDANYANWAFRQLLAGERFVSRTMPRYPDPERSRNLVPTWHFHSSHGHSASDNYFVAVAGEDHLPDLAIGRLPVATVEEVEAIVEKTVRYLAEPPGGPWRRRVLWISNDDPVFQKRSDALVEKVEALGFASHRVYPEKSERHNRHHQKSLLEAFDRGHLLVHFYGHGGRNIWRTGPPSLRKNHDLFTLEHIDRLTPNARLPFVISMTCFSAPFDHPSADSIGEKMLRTPERGAIAILAASWRSPSSLALSQNLLPELLAPGTAIGTAVLEAKRGLHGRPMVEIFNLLGDPALPLPLPAEGKELEARVDGGEANAEFTGDR